MYEVEDYDNRGTAEYPYGFVYFKDGRRVAYAKDQGVVADATGGWQPVTEQHAASAGRYLRERGIL